MKQEDEVIPDSKQESDSKKEDCPICLEPFAADQQLTLLLCCSKESSLKILHTHCADSSFANKETPSCPFCRENSPECILLDSQSLKKLAELTEEKREFILSELLKKQKEFRVFLGDNKLSSPKYFNHSSLADKLQELLKDKASPELIITFLEKYLASKEDLDATQEYGAALLFICYELTQKSDVPPETLLAAVDKLLKAKADVQIADNVGWTVLDLVCYWIDKVPLKSVLEIIDKLLKAKASARADNKNWTVLHSVCARWIEAKVPFETIVSTINKFLESNTNNLDINAATTDGWTALHFICTDWPKAEVDSKTLVAVIDAFIKSKVNVNATITDNWTILHDIAAEWGKAKVPAETIFTVIDKLLAARIDVNVATIKDGWTVMNSICYHWANAKVPAEMMFTAIDKFLDAGINVNAVTANDGWTVPHCICYFWTKAKLPAEMMFTAIDKFIAAGINVNTVTANDGWTILHSICYHGANAKASAEMMLAAIDKFLKAGINVNILNKKGESVLHLICQYWPRQKIYHETILPAITKLIGAGIKVDAVDKEGKTALKYLDSAENLPQNIDLLRAILSNSTPYKSKEFYDLLLKNYSNIPEYFDASSFSVKIAKLLTQTNSAKTVIDFTENFIATGMNVNAPDAKGRTALFHICKAFKAKKIYSETARIIIEKLFAAGIKVPEKEIKLFKKTWQQINKNALPSQQFKTLALDSDDYRYPLGLARLYRAAESSTDEIRSCYQRVIELLLKPREFTFSTEQMKLFAEISKFDEHLLSSGLARELHILFSEGFYLYDLVQACEHFHDAAKQGWLIGYLLAAYPYEHFDSMKNLNKSVQYYCNIIFSPSKNFTNDKLNKQCFEFALKKLNEYAKKGEPLALENFNKIIQLTCKVLAASDYSRKQVALENLIIIAPDVNNKDATVKIIDALIKCIEKKKDLSALRTPLLNLITALKLEKLFLETFKVESSSKLTWFADTSATKPNFSTKHAHFFIFLVSDSSEDICKNIIATDTREEMLQFCQQILENKSELPAHLLSTTINEQAQRVFSDLTKQVPDMSPA